MLNGLKPTRILPVAILGILGEGLMAGAGIWAMHLEGVHFPEFSLALGGVFGLYAYCVAMLMGKQYLSKKAKAEASGEKKPREKFSIKALGKPFMVWRYPADTIQLLLVLTGYCYYLSGLTYANPALILLSCFIITAACLGWFWPEKKLLSGYNPALVCSMMLTVSSLAYVAAGFIAHMPLMIAAGVFNFMANLVTLAPAKAAPAPAPKPEGEGEGEADKEKDEKPASGAGKAKR